ncbi:MAG: shikimate dehydrogenase [Porticoccaceae bacterium]|jgi:shikimate dehydrogenase|nr:shikimate dehydrogenase [Porticoccaceae bacterium]
MVDQYAVFGNPIAHSKSPQIHTLFAAQTQQELDYRSQLVSLGGFVAAADTFFDNAGRGLNITIPFKQEAFNYADSVSKRAAAAGAVNTLVRQENGSIFGDTTDGVGLTTDIIDNLGWQVKAKRVLLLGAGGAVRGVLENLLNLQPQHVVIANRSVDKALQLSKQFAEAGYILGCGLDMLDGQEFDVIINGTSAALDGQPLLLPNSLIGASGANCYDMMYGAMPTDFMQWSASRGAEVSDGLGMLVEQGAESFYLWRGMRPRAAEVIALLRKTL